MFFVNVLNKIYIYIFSASNVKVIIYQSYNLKIFSNTITLTCVKNISYFDFYFMKISQILFTTYYKHNIERHNIDGLTMIGEVNLNSTFLHLCVQNMIA
jgi:hypothetical protein